MFADVVASDEAGKEDGGEEGVEANNVGCTHIIFFILIQALLRGQGSRLCSWGKIYVRAHDVVML